MITYQTWGDAVYHFQEVNYVNVLLLFAHWSELYKQQKFPSAYMVRKTSRNQTMYMFGKMKTLLLLLAVGITVDCAPTLKEALRALKNAHTKSIVKHADKSGKFLFFHVRKLYIQLFKLNYSSIDVDDHVYIDCHVLHTTFLQPFIRVCINQI